MEHSEAHREKQYKADHTIGHREFWRAIFAEVRADEAAELAAQTPAVPSESIVSAQPDDFSDLVKSEASIKNPPLVF